MCSPPPPTGWWAGTIPAHHLKINNDAVYFGSIVGSLSTILVLYALSRKMLKDATKKATQRIILFNKATALYYKAVELMDTAKIWFLIGNTKDGDEALKEAERLTQEAKQCEDEANGNGDGETS